MKTKWNKETCYEEAKKYSTRSEFKKRCSSAYEVARKNKWIDDYIWFIEIRKPNGYWTYETCYEEAKKYSTRNEFQKGCSRAYTVARKNKWLDDYIWSVEVLCKPNGYWTYETCYEESKKYSTRTEFCKGCGSAYNVACKNGWINDYDWFEEICKPNGYWNKETCYEEAKKYSKRIEFQKGCSRAYAVAYKNKWLDDYDWFIEGRFKLFNDKVDSVYVYIFSDNTVYIGRTLMKRQEKRHIEHQNDNVGLYAKYNNLNMPNMQILEENLTLKEGLEREDYWVNWYKNNGYYVLNKAKTGVGSGSLGAIDNGKWNKETCYEEAKKYSTRSEFYKGSSGAYTVAYKNKWLDDYDWFEEIRKPNGYWTYEICYEEAKKYSTRYEFKKGCGSAYVVARQNKWLDDYDWFVNGNKRAAEKKTKWNKETCYEEAKKYSTRSEFKKGCGNAYNVARKNGWMDELFPQKS